MARVTVEDCIEKVDNRFELVLLAGQRARAISAGAPLTIERDNDKNPVVALREIADATVSPVTLREESIQSLQHHVEIDEPEEDELDAFEAEGLLAADGGVAIMTEEMDADGLSYHEDAAAMEFEADEEAVDGVGEFD